MPSDAQKDSKFVNDFLEEVYDTDLQLERFEKDQTIQDELLLEEMVRKRMKSGRALMAFKRMEEYYQRMSK